MKSGDMTRKSGDTIPNSDEFGLIFFESPHQPVEIANIPMNVRYFFPELRGLKIVGITGRFEGITDDVRPQFLQPDRQPRPLEPGVAGNEDFLFFVKIFEHD